MPGQNLKNLRGMKAKIESKPKFNSLWSKYIFVFIFIEVLRLKTLKTVQNPMRVFLKNLSCWFEHTFFNQTIFILKKRPIGIKNCYRKLERIKL